MPTDVYQEVTDRIVAALESGTVPWRKPWTSGTSEHHNPVSKTVYRGINPFLLDLTAQAAGYGDPRWITFNQARAKGGCVRKGEKGTLVIFWKMLRKQDDETGELRTIPLLRHYRVFNIAQVDGIEWPKLERRTFNPVECAEQIIREMQHAPVIQHGGPSAYYHPVLDTVQLPVREAFEDESAYYHTAFHELAHSTGHKTRLNRVEVTRARVAFGDGDYALEELVAELGAAMVAGRAGIEPRTNQNAAYIASWLKALRNDHKMIVTAAGRAQRAADYICDTERDES